MCKILVIGSILNNRSVEIFSQLSVLNPELTRKDVRFHPVGQKIELGNLVRQKKPGCILFDETGAETSKLIKLIKQVNVNPPEIIYIGKNAGNGAEKCDKHLTSFASVKLKKAKEAVLN